MLPESVTRLSTAAADPQTTNPASPAAAGDLIGALSALDQLTKHHPIDPPAYYAATSTSKILDASPNAALAANAATLRMMRNAPPARRTPRICQFHLTHAELFEPPPLHQEEALAGLCPAGVRILSPTPPSGEALAGLCPARVPVSYTHLTLPTILLV